MRSATVRKWIGSGVRLRTVSVQVNGAKRLACTSGSPRATDTPVRTISR